jgi:membrane-associated phospholipid phosphatase
MPRLSRRPHVVPARRLAACAWVALAAALSLPTGDAAAQDVPPAPAAPEPLRQPANLRMHGAIFAAGAATIATAGALQSRLAPSSCRWCDLHDDGTDALNGLDRAVRGAFLWQHPDTASTVSDALAFGVVPAAALGISAWSAQAAGRRDDIKVDMLVIGETVVLAANAAELLKYATARQRPYAHAGALGEPVNVAPGSSDNLSFSSGHVAFAFAMTVSAAEVATLRGRRRAAGWIWGIGLPAAAAVGYFRIAGDRHYLTDVLASAGIGTAMGLLVPRVVFKVRPPGSPAGAWVTVAPSISGSLIGVSCAW